MPSAATSNSYQYQRDNIAMNVHACAFAKITTQQIINTGIQMS